MITEERFLAVACVACGAQPGQPCRGEVAVHAARLLAASPEAQRIAAASAARRAE